MKPETDYWRHWWNEQARNSGSDYALNRGTKLRLGELEQKALQQFIEAVAPKEHDIVLDAGCGSGRNISILSPCVREIVGIDYSEQMIQRASERTSGEGLRNVKLMQGDVTCLPFATDTFDTVVCASVLQYLDVDDCSRALREMVRVCKPGGRLVLHVKNGTSLYGLSLRLLRPIARLLGRRMKPEYYRSRRWHETTLKNERAVIKDYDGFGILTFVPLPQWIVGCLLRCELRLPTPKFLKRLAVNYKMTIVVDKVASA